MRNARARPQQCWKSFKEELCKRIQHCCATLGWSQVLHDIRRIRKYLTLDSTRCLVHTLVMGRVDYCNSVNNKLQLLQNMATRIVTNTPQFCQTTPVLCQLLWLPVSVRIKFKVVLVTSKAIYMHWFHIIYKIQWKSRRSPPTTLGQKMNCYYVTIHLLIESYNCLFNCTHREIYTKFLGFLGNFAYNFI